MYFYMMLISGKLLKTLSHTVSTQIENLWMEIFISS